MTETPAPDAPDHASPAGRPDGPLAGRLVLVLVSDEGIERAELIRPREALLRAGATVHVVSRTGGRVLLLEHLDHAGTEQSQARTDDATLAGVSGIVVPGGVANADELRVDEHAVRLLTGALDAGLPVAVVCHGPWALIETGRLPGRTLTSWPSLRTDLTNAGARWVDQEVAVCHAGPGPLISSRKPDDLDAFSAAAIEAFSRAQVDHAAA